MFKAKAKLCACLFMAAALTVCLLGLFGQTFAARAEDGDSVQITTSWTGGDIIIKADGIVAGDDAQFWLARNVDYDKIDDVDRTGVIWFMAAAFGEGDSCKIPSGQIDDFLIDGKISAIIRVKSAAKVEDIFYTASKEELGIPFINGVSVNGVSAGGELIAVEKSQPISVVICDNAVSQAEYRINVAGDTFTPESGSTFELDLSGLKEGKYSFEAKASKEGAEDVFNFDVYLYEMLDLSRPVIDSFAGEKTDASTAKFTMVFSSAGGNAFTEKDLSDYSAFVTLDGKKFEAGSSAFSLKNGSIQVEINTDNISGSGIYYISAGVSRAGNLAADDSVNYYYYGHNRADSAVSQKARVDGENGVLIAEGQVIQTTTDVYIYADSAALGGVDAQDGSLSDRVLYGFYIEDAGGWKLIKGYTLENFVKWRPNKNGIYNIQIRIKELNVSGSYEAVASRLYTVGSLMSNTVSIDICESGEGGGVVAAGEKLIAGKPYVLSARFNGELPQDVTDGNILYRYTLYSKNLLTVYLSEFTPVSTLLFVPDRAEEYVFTVRALTLNSYGYTEVTGSRPVESEIVVPEVDITTAAQLKEATNANVRYVLKNDISFTSSDFVESDGIISAINEFNGILDGNGYKITAVRGAPGETDTMHVAFINNVGKHATIENTRFDLNIAMTSKTASGVFIENNRGTIKNCYVKVLSSTTASATSETIRTSVIWEHSGALQNIIFDLEYKHGGTTQYFRGLTAICNTGTFSDIIIKVPTAAILALSISGYTNRPGGTFKLIDSGDEITMYTGFNTINAGNGSVLSIDSAAPTTQIFTAFTNSKKYLGWDTDIWSFTVGSGNPITLKGQIINPIV